MSTLDILGMYVPCLLATQVPCPHIFMCLTKVKQRSQRWQRYNEHANFEDCKGVEEVFRLELH